DPVRCRSLLDDQMGIRSAKTKRAYGSATCTARFYIPLPQVCVHIKRTVLKFNLGVSFLEVQGRRNLPVLQRKQDFDQASDTGCRRGVSNVGLDRSQSTVLLLIGIFTKSPSEGMEFDWVSKFGPCAMRLHHLDFLRMNAEGFIHLAFQTLLR